MKIYEIQKELSRLFDDIEQVGEVTSQALEAMQHLETEYNNKMGGIAAHILNLQAESEALKSESERLADRAKSCEKRIEGYEQFLKMACPDGGTFGLHKIKWRKSEAVKLLVDEDKVPDQYRREKVSYTIDKAGIKADLKNKADLMFAEIETRQNLKVE